MAGLYYPHYRRFPESPPSEHAIPFDSTLLSGGYFEEVYRSPVVLRTYYYEPLFVPEYQTDFHAGTRISFGSPIAYHDTRPIRPRHSAIMSGGPPPQWQPPPYRPEIFTGLPTSYAFGAPRHLQALASDGLIGPSQAFPRSATPWALTSPPQAGAQHIPPAPGVSSTAFPNGVQQTPYGGNAIVAAGTAPRPLPSGGALPVASWFSTGSNNSPRPGTETKRVHTLEPHAERAAKMARPDEPTSKRLRIGNLRHRVTMDDIKHLLRNYQTDQIQLIQTRQGLNALVTLADPALVRDAIYKLWGEKVHDQLITIEIDLEIASHYLSKESAPTTTRTTTKSHSNQPKSSKPAAFSKTRASPLPVHLYHRTSFDLVSNFKDGRDSPDLKAIAEKRRVYIYSLPFQTNERTLQDLLKDLNVENLTIPYDWNTRQSTGYYAFVDFTTPKDADKALSSLSGIRIRGVQIHANAKPTPTMLRKPNTNKGDEGHLKVTGLAFETKEMDIRVLFYSYSILFTRVTLPKYLDSECPPRYAFVDFDSPAAAELAAVRLSSLKPTILGHLVEFEEVTKQEKIRREVARPALQEEIGHFSEPKEQLEDLSSEVADEENRAELKAWWMEERGVNLDI